MTPHSEFWLNRSFDEGRHADSRCYGNDDGDDDDDDDYKNNNYPWLAEPLWTGPCLNSGVEVYEIISI